MLVIVGNRKNAITHSLPAPVKTRLRILKVWSKLALDVRKSRPSLDELRQRLDHEETTNCALLNDQAVDKSLAKLKALNLRPHSDKNKNWDAYRAFSVISLHGSPSSVVLDAGSGFYSAILNWLRCFGYESLYGCDLVVEQPFKRHSTQYSHQNIQHTNYESEKFDFITCLSVIEHGVDTREFLTEMRRLLKPGGRLIVSTDFWHEPIETAGLYPYGPDMGEMKVFVPQEIERFVEEAKNVGLKLNAPINYRCEERVVHWERVDRRYTFIFLALQKATENSKATTFNPCA